MSKFKSKTFDYFECKYCGKNNVDSTIPCQNSKMGETYLCNIVKLGKVTNMTIVTLDSDIASNKNSDDLGQIIASINA